MNTFTADTFDAELYSRLLQELNLSDQEFKTAIPKIEKQGDSYKITFGNPVPEILQDIIGLNEADNTVVIPASNLTSEGSFFP